MEQIVVTRPGKKPLPLFRRQPLSTVTKATQSRKLLGDDTVSMTIETTSPLELAIGDNVVVFGGLYTINQTPTATKFSERGFTYELMFEGPQYQLLKILFLNQDATGFATGADFSLTGTLDRFASLLLTNIDRVLGTGQWALGVIPGSSPTKTLSFSSENVLVVLQKICTEFETEFRIDWNALTGIHTLSFAKQGDTLDHTFEYGRGRGLYNLSRETVSNEAFITRLYAFGGSRNIPSSYRGYSAQLRLDNDLSFLENQAGIRAFGLIEGANTWPDIYPRRTGTLTAVGAVTDGAKTFTVKDASLDFDLLEESGPALIVNGKPQKQYKYLLPGVSAKFHVNSGNLAGYEFEINDYNHGSKTFTLVSYQNEQGMLIPSATSDAFRPSVGDQYVLLDIRMPDSYVTAAETELRAAAQTYLAEHSRPRVQYSIKLDTQYLKSQVQLGLSVPNFFDLGDYVNLLDKALNIDNASRVIGYTRNLLNPYEYTLEIADTYQITTVERVLTNQAAVKTIVQQNQLNDPTRAQQNKLTTEEVIRKILDPNGNYDPSRLQFFERGLPVLNTAGGVQLTGSDGVGQAGITGQGNLPTSVRIWAGKPYQNRKIAPFRVLADGSVVTTAGKIAGWTITNSGIANTDGKAFIIAATSTNPHRTEARIGAGVFSAVTGAKGASSFVATEPGSLDNYAAVFDARNGFRNYAILAQNGISQLGEALINGRRYHGQAVNDATLTLDPSLYDVIELYPTGSSAALRFSAPSKPLGNGKMITILNVHDTFNNLFLNDIVRGNATYQLAGGFVKVLLFTNGFWYVVSEYDNNFGETPAPFSTPPVNNPPTATSIPNFTTTTRNNNTYQIPASAFSDPDGEALSFYIISILPDWITFDGGSRIFTIDRDTAQNGQVGITARAVDSANQGVQRAFSITITWPAESTEPVVINPIPDQTIVGTGVHTFAIPSNTFQTENPPLTYSAAGPSGAALPAGITFAGSVYTLADTISDGTCGVMAIATDQLGQSVSDTFFFVVSRNGAVDGVITVEDTNFTESGGGTSPSGSVTETGTATHNGQPVNYIKIAS